MCINVNVKSMFKNTQIIKVSHKMYIKSTEPNR